MVRAEVPSPVYVPVLFDTMTTDGMRPVADGGVKLSVILHHPLPSAAAETEPDGLVNVPDLEAE